MSESILSVEAMDSCYEDFQALYGVNLELHEGEVVAIIGANGAGKTTLLRSIVGLINNKAEQVQYRGEAIGNLRADQIAVKGIAMVPEGRQLFPSLSVEENLLIGGRVQREGPWSLSAIYELFPVLQERRQQASTSLSGGQQQMVAIGRALMSNPSVILFDEISLGLAPVIIKNIYEAFPGIIQHGMTAVIVEQEKARALSVSSRVYCLQEGRVSLQGDSASVSRDDISRAYFGVS